jgi:hypothetical protein
MAIFPVRPMLERTLELTEKALKEQGKRVESEIVLGHPAEKS